jgi:ATP-dependent DNA helicase UvrD/PcrA
MKSHEPTEEQRPILESSERIRIVRAVPGSGKTWLVGEAIRQELKEWQYSTRGIAALSFTNVARDEIRNALGYELSYPHFVGTLDSFIYRFIARPFARLYDPSIKPLCLVPADNAAILGDAQRWCSGGINIPVGGNTRRANLFRIQFVGDSEKGPIFTTRVNDWEPSVTLSPEIGAQVFKKKLSVWRTSGRVSHSDVAYIASKILSDATRAFPRDVLLRRFPLILVDELQDTGWYLGRIILNLLKHQRCRAILVGDPDQAIYEFNGARPELFEDFERVPGAKVFPIDTSSRCRKKICRVAELLASSGRRIESSKTGDGTTIIAIRDGAENEVLALCGALRSGSLVTAVVTRANSTIQKLKGGSPTSKPGFNSQALMSLHRAVNAMRAGNMKQAHAFGVAALARPLLGADVVSDADFEEFKIDAFQWKRRVVNLLIGADKEISGETLYDWGCRMRDLIEVEIKLGVGSIPPCISKAPRRPPGNTKHEQRTNYLTPRAKVIMSLGVPIQTIHAAKGETHHTTVLYVPRQQSNRCPSILWWSSDPAFQEERRIAFVAATRPTSRFILCVHRETYERLLKSRPEFVKAFEVQNLADVITGCKEGDS